MQILKVKQNPENIFFYVSWRNKKLFAYSQIGHVEKFLDTFIWIFFPIYLFNNGIKLIEISYIVGVHMLLHGVFFKYFLDYIQTILGEIY